MLRRYSGALVAVSAFIPIPMFAAFFTALLYLLLYPSFQPAVIILLGLGCTMVVLLFLAFVFEPLATAEGGKLADYEMLQGDLQVMKAQLSVVKSDHQSEKEYFQSTIAEIESEMKQIKETLQQPGLMWVMRTGYIRVWNRMNKVKEAMMDVLPPELVIESAQHALLRLRGSTITERDRFIQQLETAISILKVLPDRTKQVSEDIQVLSLQKSLPNVALIIHASEVEPFSSSTAICDDQQSARSTIRQIQCFLHQYRCERWDGLVRARNQLLGAALLASILLYLMLDVAILASIPQQTLIYISVFYLIGAIVGLFGRLLNEVRSNDAEIAHMDDYGLTGARIMVTPFLSGLAPLVGVPLVIIALEVIQLQVPGSVQSSTGVLPIPMENVYDFFRYPQNLLLAAVFGYMPSLVISFLKRQAHQIQGELLSSSPGKAQGNLSD